jgi:predicted acetyltransferase
VHDAARRGGERAIELRALTADVHPAIERLWQLYRHDLSEFRDSIPQEDGTFSPGRLPLFLEDDPDRVAYLFVLDGRPVGFALIWGLAAGPLNMVEFFVARSARRRGVAHEAMRQIFERHPGAWEIAFQEANAGAARFWRRLLPEAREEAHPVPGKPHIPPDVWLVFER